MDNRDLTIGFLRGPIPIATRATCAALASLPARLCALFTNSAAQPDFRYQLATDRLIRSVRGRVWTYVRASRFVYGRSRSGKDAASTPAHHTPEPTAEMSSTPSNAITANL
jgi:hypothetical protein